MEVLNGSSLIQTLVSLTELPEPLAHREVDEMLSLSGHSSESLTLEELRASMLRYLESMQATFESAENSEKAHSGNEACEVEKPLNDASASKTLVFLG